MNEVMDMGNTMLNVGQTMEVLIATIIVGVLISLFRAETWSCTYNHCRSCSRSRSRSCYFEFAWMVGTYGGNRNTGMCSRHCGIVVLPVSNGSISYRIRVGTWHLYSMMFPGII